MCSLALDALLLDEPPVGLVPNGVELVEAEVRKHSGE
jgi:ABC-type branched-subunit amino acid transport system ATPase component